MLREEIYSCLINLSFPPPPTLMPIHLCWASRPFPPASSKLLITLLSFCRFPWFIVPVTMHDNPLPP